MTNRFHAAAAVIFVAALLSFACSNDGDVFEPPPDSGTGTLTFTSSTPANGNAVLDAPSIFHEANADGGSYDRITVTQAVAGITHSLYFYYTAPTETVHSAQHVWGPIGGVTQCVAGSSDCVAANVTIDTPGESVTFTNLVLPQDPVNGTATSTVSGTLAW
jgi:hypothetical protein